MRSTERAAAVEKGHCMFHGFTFCKRWRFWQRLRQKPTSHAVIRAWVTVLRCVSLDPFARYCCNSARGNIGKRKGTDLKVERHQATATRCAKKHFQFDLLFVDVSQKVPVTSRDCLKSEAWLPHACCLCFLQRPVADAWRATTNERAQCASWPALRKADEDGRLPACIMIEAQATWLSCKASLAQLSVSVRSWARAP